MLRKARRRDRKAAGIDLQMMTTNLSTSRPMRVPKDLVGFAFAPGGLDGVLPGTVIEWLMEKGTPEGGLYRLPAEDDLLVLLGFRLSLSFPLLFTAVQLRASAPETLQSDPVPHWLSDGGIASNFPVHFFDAWARRPTFALSFAPFPVGPDGRRLPEETDVGLPPGANESRLPRWGPDHRYGWVRSPDSRDHAELARHPSVGDPRLPRPCLRGATGQGRRRGGEKFGRDALSLRSAGDATWALVTGAER
jgi:hypothetical protein